MATIVYLDAEDEITSAATRIRSAGDTRVGLVLPFGSRLATSRINFRLLAREAMANGRRLDLIAQDASARALAASAGLPVFASVAEYEDALDEAESAAEGSPTSPTPPTAPAPPAGARSRRAPRAAATPRAIDDGAPAPGADDPADGPGAEPASSPARRPRPADAGHAEPQAPRGDPRVVRPRRRFRPGPAMIAGVGVLALALVVAGVAAYVLLPSAEVTIRPRIERVGPVTIVVSADPDAGAVDPVAGIIPARLVTVPVRTSGEFPATGVRVEETKAVGLVRWTNCDPTASYTVPKGSTIRTTSGIAFTTDEPVFLPVAILSGSPPNVTVDCQTGQVSVTAVKAGTAGNVAAGAIRVVPSSYNANVIRVTNPDATSGGARTEYLKVSQEDIDGAIEQLRKDIASQFATQLQDPPGVPAGATVFVQTAALGEPVPDIDPQTLLGQEVGSFTLQMEASGSVLAVDASPARSIAEDRLAASISPGFELVTGSVQVVIGEGTVRDGVVSFEVTGSARQVRPVDVARLEAAILGLGRSDAEAELAPYGTVTIVLWPDWVQAIPTLDQRVTLTVGPPDDSAIPSPAPSGTPTMTPAPAPPEASPPSASPGASGDGPPGEPVPSG